MPIEVKIPALGESISSGILSSWKVAEGSYVEIDQPIYELETDKITQEGLAEAGRAKAPPRALSSAVTPARGHSGPLAIGAALGHRARIGPSACMGRRAAEAHALRPPIFGKGRRR